jgi:hypothetical protein
MLSEEIDRAYRQGIGKWTGCDWQTEFGKTGLNLKGLKASQALLLARATSGSERADWRAAVAWLARIEQHTKEAEEEARQAVTLAKAGKLPEALACAQRACAVEAKYHNQLVWQPLREVIVAAQHGAAE